MTTLKFPENIIKRDYYLSEIRPFMRKNLIKVLTGQRRVGKSYILYQIINEILNDEPDASIIYINMEDLGFSSIQNAHDLDKYVRSHFQNDRMNYLFIDEIQEIDQFEKALRSLLLKENIDVYCTGSNAKLLSGELSTLLSGRYIEIQIYSLSYIEFLRFHNLADSNDALDRYFRFGGLPYLIHLDQNDKVLQDYLNSIYHAIIYRDVISRYNIRAIKLLEQLVAFLANNVGSLFSAKAISDYLKSQQIKIAPNQIQNYIEYLSNAFIIHKVSRYDIVGKKIFETGSKNYFENTGIRNAIIGYKPDDIGKVLENVVFNHLISCGYDVKVGTLKANEIDFVCEKNAEKIYVQVALMLRETNTIKREFGNLLQINDNYRKIVVTMDSFSGGTYDGIEHYHIRDFLLSLK